MNKEFCSICGKERQVVTRDRDGRPICKNCNRKNHLEFCSICGNLRPVCVRLEEHAVCDACYQKNRLEFCSICGKFRPVKARSSEGPICGTCCIYLDPLQILKKYKRDAKKRQLLFTLSDDQFCALISLKCHYCGQIIKKFNGIDRIDNNFGYIEGNCVPCCGICNIMKHIMKHDEFIIQCHLISTHCGNNLILDDKAIKLY